MLSEIYSNFKSKSLFEKTEELILLSALIIAILAIFGGIASFLGTSEVFRTFFSVLGFISLVMIIISSLFAIVKSDKTD